MLSILTEWFSAVITADSAVFLPVDELAEALGAEDRDELFVAGVVTPWVIVLYRGDFSPLFVPREWFRSRPGAPDFSKLALTDYGQTVKLGDYEVAADALLYEFDPWYRRRVRDRELETDSSFGAALRRLRLQRAVSRSDFPGISEKGIARLERNEVRPRKRTLELIASRLDVQPEEVASY